MKVRARNIHQLAVMIQDWFAAQGEYYDGGLEDSTIDGNYDLTSLARYLADYSLYEIFKALVKREKLPYADLPSEEAAIPWAKGSEACNVWSGGHPINQRCQLIKGHEGPHRGDKGAFTV